MIRRIISCIPNTITLLNLLSGCVAIIFAFSHSMQFGSLSGLEWAYVMIGAAAVFDFLDGASARALRAYSALGKELDSLSDLVSFGAWQNSTSTPRRAPCSAASPSPPTPSSG